MHGYPWRDPRLPDVSASARITPAQAGLTAFGRNRRVPGLRREEVALLAGISVEYYTRLERGTAAGVSEDVLEAIARALQLDEAERAHLFDLVRAANTSRAPRRRLTQDRVRPMVQRIIDSVQDCPAYVRNGRLDILAANPLGAALYSPLFDDPVRPTNVARFVFLNPRPGTSTATGRGSPTMRSPFCAPKPGRTPTTGALRTSSASCPLAARTSVRGGPRTTSSSPAPTSRRSTIPSSAI